MKRLDKHRAAERAREKASMDFYQLRERFPFKPYGVYEFGEAMSHPFEDDGVWIFAREQVGDPTSARYVPLDDRARERVASDGRYIPDFGEHFENYSPVKDLLP